MANSSSDSSTVRGADSSRRQFVHAAGPGDPFS